MKINYGINRKARRGSVMVWQHENHCFFPAKMPTTQQMLKRVRVYHSGWQLTGFATARPAPNRRDPTLNRVRLGGGGPPVHPKSAASLAAWQARLAHAEKKISIGTLLDRVIEHAERTNFDPAVDVF